MFETWWEDMLDKNRIKRELSSLLFCFPCWRFISVPSQPTTKNLFSLERPKETIGPFWSLEHTYNFSCIGIKLAYHDEDSYLSGPTAKHLSSLERTKEAIGPFWSLELRIFHVLKSSSYTILSLPAVWRVRHILARERDVGPLQWHPSNVLIFRTSYNLRSEHHS